MSGLTESTSMATTDIDGRPLLLLSLDEARLLQQHLDSPQTAVMDAQWVSLYRKIRRFVEEFSVA